MKRAKSETRTKRGISSQRCAREIFDVGECLRLREAEVFVEALVLDEEHAAPEEINRALVALDVDDVCLELSERGAAEAEDAEKFVPESLLLRALRAVTRVFARKAEGAVADFVSGEMRHGAV